MRAALQLDGLVKRYRGGPPALDGLSCLFPEGTITGFVGPNGAGKTTTFSAVCGFLRCEEGTIDVLGMGPYDPHEMKGLVGVLPQDAALSDRHTPRELLVHLGRLQGLGRSAAREEADRLLGVVQLTDRARDRIASLSHGMRRRVAVASALVGSPRLVMLDEPLAGLDPVQQRSLRDALAALRGIQTLIVSSHNLAELERLCDWVVMIDRGRLKAQGTMAEVTGQAQRVEWVLGPGEVPLERLRTMLPDDALTVEDGVLIHQTSGDLDQASMVVMQALVEANVAVRELRRGMGLERRFIDETA